MPTLQLIDQSEPDKLRYRCDTCEAVVQAPTRASAEKHKCNPDAIEAFAARVKAQAAAVAKAPRAKRAARRPYPVVLPEVEPTPAPKKRGRPRKVVEPIT